MNEYTTKKMYRYDNVHCVMYVNQYYIYICTIHVSCFKQQATPTKTANPHIIILIEFCKNI